MLRRQSLIALLENNNYLRKSMKGLKEDMPDVYNWLKGEYLKSESYFILELLENRQALIDEKYMIWVRNGELPHIFENKEQYSKVEFYVFSLKTNIPVEEFEEIIEATS